MVKQYGAKIQFLVVLSVLLLGCESKSGSSSKVWEQMDLPERERDQERVIKIRASHFPPLNYCTEEGKWTGLDVELVRAMVQRAGFTHRFVEMPWTRALIEMKRGNVDIMMDLSKTLERSEYMHWIGPVRYSTMVLVVAKEHQNLPVFSIDDLVKVAKEQKGRFGIQKNVFYSDAFNKRLADPKFACHFDSCCTPESNVRKLLGGRILGFFEEKHLVEYNLKRSPLGRNMVIHSFSLTKDPLYFGISKKSVPPRIFNGLKKAFNELEKEGTMKKIRSTEW